MTENYLMLIIDGWINNNEFLENYFYRAFKTAQKQDIPPDEFVLHLNKEVIRIDRIRLEPYYSQLEMWNDYYVQEAKKGNKVDIPIPDNKDGYSTPLLPLTNGKYVGHIGKPDLDYIQDCIDRAFEKVNGENQTGKTEIAKWFINWLNMSVEEKYDYSLTAYKEKFPRGTVEDFHLIEKEHLLERIDNYKKLVNPDAYEIKAKIEREKLIKYIDELAKERESQQTGSRTSEENHNDLCNVPFIGDLLKKNLNISENILDAFYSLVPQPLKREDVSNHYVGKLNHYNQPYKISINGAYPLMNYWEMVEYKMENVNDESGYFKDWEKEKVYEAMKDYAKGFQYGFDNFIKEMIDDQNSLSNSETIRLQKIKDYVYNWLNNSPGFSEAHGKGVENVFSHWYNDGMQGGYYYKAWYLILDNHLAFSVLFKQSAPQVFEDLKTFFDQVIQDDARAEESFNKGFKKLHDYINKNVHNDVRADLPTLQLRETNLFNWKVQLEHDEVLNSEPWKPKTDKIISHINGALEIIRLRIKRMEQGFVREQTKGTTSVQKIEISLSEIQNNFDNVDISIVYNHFKSGLVDKKYFTEDELMKYLKAAFQIKDVPQTRFKFANAPTKDKIMEVFYRYYRDVAVKPHGKQSMYAALLGDYFEGYNTKTVSTNFSKTVY
jgi:hypothetical protein